MKYMLLLFPRFITLHLVFHSFISFFYIFQSCITFPRINSQPSLNLSLIPIFDLSPTPLDLNLTRVIKIITIPKSTTIQNYQITRIINITKIILTSPIPPTIRSSRIFTNLILSHFFISAPHWIVHISTFPHFYVHICSTQKGVASMRQLPQAKDQMHSRKLTSLCPLPETQLTMRARFHG